MAKLQLKLDEEELDIDTGIAVSHAKSEVLQKYENIPEEQSLNRFDLILLRIRKIVLVVLDN